MSFFVANSSSNPCGSSPSGAGPGRRLGSVSGPARSIRENLRAITDQGDELAEDNDAIWKQLMLMPEDYSDEALFDEETRGLMELIEFQHGRFR